MSHCSIGDVEENVAPRLLSENSFDGSENNWDIEGNRNFTEVRSLATFSLKKCFDNINI